MNDNEKIKDTCREKLEDIFNIAETSPPKSEDFIFRELEKDLDDIMKESQTIVEIEKYATKRAVELMESEKEIESENDLDDILENDSIFFNR